VQPTVTGTVTGARVRVTGLLPSGGTSTASVSPPGRTVTRLAA
jgi:hypothetical protein